MMKYNEPVILDFQNQTEIGCSLKFYHGKLHRKNQTHIENMFITTL